MKNMKWALVALVLGLSAAGCSVFQGEDGTVEGKLVDYNGTGYWYNFGLWLHDDYDFGFPTSFYWNTFYEIDPGTYGFYVVPEDAYYYYYGSAYEVVYTVKANKGSFLQDGKDKQFTITLYATDATATGLKIVGVGGVSETQPDGTAVFKNSSITVEASIKKLDKLPEGAVKLNAKE